MVRFRTKLAKTATRYGKAMAPATVNRHLALLRSALNVAETNGYLHRNPVRGVKLLPENNERDRICSPEEFWALVDYHGPRLVEENGTMREWRGHVRQMRANSAGSRSGLERVRLELAQAERRAAFTRSPFDMRHLEQVRIRERDCADGIERLEHGIAELRTRVAAMPLTPLCQWVQDNTGRTGADARVIGFRDDLGEIELFDGTKVRAW